jgi:hypothetical protein
MAFTDAQTRHIAAITGGPMSQLVTFVPQKTSTRTQVRALIHDEDIDTVEGLAHHHRRVRVAKSAVPAVRVHEDQFEIGDKRYTIIDIVDDRPTYWLFEVTQA